MEDSIVKKSKFYIISVIVFALFITYLFFGVENAKKSTDEEKHMILADAINRSAVQCYAIEGYYPPNIEYLEDNYGLFVDHNKYVVSYSVFASNIIPQIEVFLK